jgi:hypothetical protein
MDAPLVPCPSCSRHVRAADAACPFCAAVLPPDLAATAVPGTTARLGRAATFVFGASLALGCSGTTGPADSVADNGGVQPVYGAPVYDVVANDTAPAADVPPDVPRDNGGIAPAYGLPRDF